MSTSTAHHTHQHLRGQTNAAKQAENSAPADTKAKDGHEERFRLIQVHAYGLWERAGKPNDDDSRCGAGSKPRRQSSVARLAEAPDVVSGR